MSSKWERCARFVPSAAIVCSSFKEITSTADALNVERDRVKRVDAPDSTGAAVETFRQEISEASASGLWAVVDVPSNDHALWLRTALHEVWLKYTWSHHELFRLWIIVSFIGPGELDVWMDSTGRFLLQVSSIHLRFCDNFPHEFKVRDLVSAVIDSHVFAVAAERDSVLHVSGQDVVDLVRAATAEGSLISLLEEAPDAVQAQIAAARDDDGRSVLDVTVAKGFETASVLARNVGCRSETFDFDLLLDPSFQPLFELLLDVERPFPFDAVKSSAVIANAGRWQVLRRLFDCRIDVRFAAADYPLVEACNSGCFDTVHTVVDRMSATGVHPFRDGPTAANFIPRLLRLMDSEKQASDELSFNEQTTWALTRLCRVAAEDEVKVRIPMHTLRGIKDDPALVQSLLEVADVDNEPEPAAQMLYFARYDPGNPLAPRVCRSAAVFVSELEGVDVDAEAFSLARQLACAGAPAVHLLREFVSRALEIDVLSLTRRQDGSTLLMECFRPPCVYVEAAACLVEVADQHRAKDRFVCQIDDSGNNSLVRLCVDVSQNPEAFSPAHAAADGVKLLIECGCPAVVRPPAFSATLFEMAARSAAGDVAFELLAAPGVPRPNVLVSTTIAALSSIARRGFALQRMHEIDSRVASYASRAGSLPLVAVPTVGSFLELPEVALFSQCCVALRLACLVDVVWQHRLGSSPGPTEHFTAAAQAWAWLAKN